MNSYPATQRCSFSIGFREDLVEILYDKNTYENNVSTNTFAVILEVTLLAYVMSNHYKLNPF